MSDRSKSDSTALDSVKWAEVAQELMNVTRELEQEPNMPLSHLALLTGARGPAFNCLTACAASTQAIGEATEILRRGDAIVDGKTHGSGMLARCPHHVFGRVDAGDGRAQPRQRFAHQPGAATDAQRFPASGRQAIVLCEFVSFSYAPRAVASVLILL